MNTGNLPPEFQFLRSAAGALITIVVALASLFITLIWAGKPGQKERWLAVGAATLTSLLVIAITIIAVVMRWWQGAFFTSIPFWVIAAIYVPFSIAGYTLWLGLYRWLARKTRRAWLIYAFIVLAFIPVVLIVDPIQMQRDQFTMGGGYTVWADTLVGQIVMASPVFFYELLRRKARIIEER